ncbi:hypothetical protein DWB84_18890 [Saccharophagus sp. K07]|jgi:hypothetical protein|uniref:hypothetical protein n=1 Tax=Saccharophagus sp. K07 TaxID=2283636 RepID=UPI0016522301|nr:hypothetical protein [Saccharophagus sp. K07]MBC6907506.1 hypothetical protein [Saccharophagus sp. K07]
MKRLILFVLILAPINWVKAETAEHEETDIVLPPPAPIMVENGSFIVEDGQERWGYDNLSRAQAHARAVGMSNLPPSPHQKARSELLKNLGLGELERSALSWSRYEDIKVYRGANTDLLFTMLKHKELATSWNYIAWTIGAVADEAAAKKLADYLSTPEQLDTRGEKSIYIQTRTGGFLGLTLAAKEGPMPWINNYLMTHADPDEWIKIFKAKGLEIDNDSAKALAARAVNAITQLGQGDPLVMLQEVRERRLAKQPIQPLAAGKHKESFVEYIDGRIEYLKRWAEAGENPGCVDVCP